MSLPGTKDVKDFVKKCLTLKVEKYISKSLSIVLIFALIGSYGHLNEVFAQATPTDTSTPAPTQTTVDNSASTNTTTTTDSNTGNNTAGTSSSTPTTTPTPDPSVTPADTLTTTPTPTINPQNTPTGTPAPTIDTTITPTDTPTVSPTPDPSITPDATDSATIDNTGTVTNTSTSSATTGNNSLITTDNGGSSSNSQPPADQPQVENPTPTPTPSVSIMTGDAVAITNVNNNINSTSVNSNIVNQVINIYIDQNASLDLSDPATFIADTIKDHPNDPTINLHITSVTNQATVTNTVTSVANTGNNTATSPNGAAVTTGNAYSIVSDLNRVNFIAIDSVVHVVTINIFGTLNGDIILPVPVASTASDQCPQCSGNTTVTNTATVTNSVTSGANTGDNTVTASTSGSVQTGDATSQVSINNLVNTVLIGDNVFSLYIIPFGTWNGNFVGYQSVDPNTLNTMVIQGTNGQTAGSSFTATNSATVTNVINSQANTGSNSVQAGSGIILTGNALSDVSLINLVNTVLYKTTAFFGFINIFGTWNGNVGDLQSLAAAEATPTPAAQVSSDNSGPGGASVQDSGGQLSVTNSNNVGAYVFPGDTVTFFINVKNPGSGHVYNASLYLHLLKDGNDVGGQTFSLGTINPSHGFKITTGFVLSKTTPGGSYIARADVTGYTGADNTSIGASSDSTFSVQGAVLGAATGDLGDSGASIIVGSVPLTVHVLGATTTAGDTPNALLALLVLFLLIPEYIFFRASRNRKLFSLAFASNVDWQSRLRAIHMLLL